MRVMPIREIDVLIPLADGERLHHEVLSALLAQDVICHVLPISRPRSDSAKGRKSQTECRNLLRVRAAGRYALMMDSDVVLSRPTDVSEMARYLDENPVYGAVGLRTKRHVTSHVIISCVCVRSEILRATPFHNDNDRCNCIGFTNAITTCYLDDRILQEIDRRDTE